VKESEVNESEVNESEVLVMFVTLAGERTARNISEWHKIM